MRTLAALTLILAQALPPIAAAQPAASPGAAPPAVFQLSDQPERFPSLGITILPIAGTRIERVMLGNVSTTRLGLPDGLGLVVVRPGPAAAAAGTPDDLTRTLIAQHLRLGSAPAEDAVAGRLTAGAGTLLPPGAIVDADGVRIRPRYLVLDERDAAVGIATLTAAAGRPAPADALTPPTIVELYTTGSNLTRARAAYELMLGTLRPFDPRAEDERRAAAIGLGAAVIDRSRDALARLFTETGTRTLQRYYRPAPGGMDEDATELGYRLITRRFGPRGLMTERPRARWDTADKEEGYILEIRARLLLPDGHADTLAAFFLAENRLTENWTTTTAIRRQGRDGSPEVWTETGVRDRDDITVQVARTGQRRRAFDVPFAPSGYTSRLESFVMPQILALSDFEGLADARPAPPPADAEATAGEPGPDPDRSRDGRTSTDDTEGEPSNASPQVAFYSYNQGEERLSLRLHTVDLAPGLPDVRRITSARPEEPSQVTTVNRFGEIVSVKTQDGALWEASDRDTLMRLWDVKGLPLD